MKLKYVYKLIKWNDIVVNHFLEFKWFITFIKINWNEN